MNGAKSLVQTLLNSGVDACFANPGTSEMHFVAALDQNPGMRCVLGLHENVVTGMADGYCRIARKPACTLLHCGPGLANGLANLHNARRARSGIVNIVGDQATDHRPLRRAADRRHRRPGAHGVGAGSAPARRGPGRARRRRSGAGRANGTRPGRDADPAVGCLVERRRRRRRCASAAVAGRARSEGGRERGARAAAAPRPAVACGDALFDAAQALAWAIAQRDRRGARPTS